MARASWKYHFFKESEIFDYISYITDEQNNLFNAYNNDRHKTITKLNCFTLFTINTGKWLVDRSLTKYHIGIKLGQLTKTRKPFYFRSKKKKNVTKKNPLPKNPKNLT